ncbi:hypothetical protein E4T56_gene2808 [Termitomyces sp. T112]|nr:hypothetical protein E4T56_gene2808 [Termitomyces sp. T112]
MFEVLEVLDRSYVCQIRKDQILTARRRLPASMDSCTALSTRDGAAFSGSALGYVLIDSFPHECCMLLLNGVIGSGHKRVWMTILALAKSDMAFEP